MGHFKLGSTVVLIFGPQAISLLADIGEGSRVLMGQAIAAPAHATDQRVYSIYEQQ